MLGGRYNFAVGWKQKQNKVQEEPRRIHTHQKTIPHGQQTCQLPWEVLQHMKAVPCPRWRMPSLAQYRQVTQIRPSERKMSLKSTWGINWNACILMGQKVFYFERSHTSLCSLPTPPHVPAPTDFTSFSQHTWPIQDSDSLAWFVFSHFLSLPPISVSADSLGLS